MAKLLASWSSEHQVWITDQTNQLLEQWVLWQAPWPKSGMTAGGKLFELATWEHRTDENESLSSDIDEESMLRTPSAIEGGGGANSAAMKKAKGRMVMVRDQMADLAVVNGLKTSETIQADAERYDAAGDLLPTPTAVQARNATSGRQPDSQHHAGTTLHDLVFDGTLLPTPTVGHIRNNDEPIEDYLARRAKGESGEYRGMPGISLGVAVRMETQPELLPTPTTQESSGTCRDHGGDLLHEVTCGCPRQERALLPTVKARDAIAEGYEAGMRRQSPQIGTIAKGITDGDERVLMPTPKAADGTNGNLKTSAERKAAGFFVDLPNVAVDINLLPTPLVDDAKNSGENQVRRATLASEAYATQEKTNWGKYAPAIRRWEQKINRLAPAPTRPDGKNGAHRLNPEFTEWMMGLPAGWITGHGLKRNDELKMAGNGVCPQQAYHAVSNLLIDMMMDLRDD